MTPENRRESKPWPKPEQFETFRYNLNNYFAEEAGQAELLGALETGNFIVELAEEMALLKVAYYNKIGEKESASKILQTIKPFFNQIRFYPMPAPGKLEFLDNTF